MSRNGRRVVGTAPWAVGTVTEAMFPTHSRMCKTVFVLPAGRLVPTAS